MASVKKTTEFRCSHLKKLISRFIALWRQKEGIIVLKFRNILIWWRENKYPITNINYWKQNIAIQIYRQQACEKNRAAYLFFSNSEESLLQNMGDSL